MKVAAAGPGNGTYLYEEPATSAGCTEGRPISHRGDERIKKIETSICPRDSA